MDFFNRSILFSIKKEKIGGKKKYKAAKTEANTAKIPAYSPPSNDTIVTKG